jgi:hypothetical protein
MKLSRGILAAAATLLAVAVASDALAARPARSGGHGAAHAGARPAHPGARPVHPGGRHYAPRYGTGVFIGAPLFAPFYYYPPPPPYYYPAPIMAPAPTTYIEQYPGQSAPDPSSYWYFCASANAYYPYVSDCPEGWQPVAPQPPS